MNQKRLLISAAIIGVAIVAGFLLSVPHTTRDAALVLLATSTPPALNAVLRDNYKKGLHTISGSLMVPTACTIATTSARVVGEASSTRHILVAVGLSKDTDVCLQLPTRIVFTTTLAAPAALPVEMMVNGALASTTDL